jgi:hypothetical protein
MSILNTVAEPLLIKRVDAFGLNLPLNKIVLMAGVELSCVENLLIRIDLNMYNTFLRNLLMNHLRKQYI